MPGYVMVRSWILQSANKTRNAVRRKVDSGIYSSADDVLANALDRSSMNAMTTSESELADMREKVRTYGLEESKAGLAVPASEVFDELRRRNAEAASEKR